MNIIFFETEKQLSAFYPLTFSRPIAALRLGILTIAQKWKHDLNARQTGFLTLPHLRRRFSFPFSHHYIYINSALLIDNQLITKNKITETGPSFVLRKWVGRTEKRRNFYRIKRLNPSRGNGRKRTNQGRETSIFAWHFLAKCCGNTGWFRAIDRRPGKPKNHW